MKLLQGFFLLWRYQLQAWIRIYGAGDAFLPLRLIFTLDLADQVCLPLAFGLIVLAKTSSEALCCC